MAKLQQKSKLWYHNLNEARGYFASNWALIAASICFAVAVTLIIIYFL